eukprot:CAMPEP_0116824768 /NCGR_PEP_ID=MMETSP0418-20121206/1581_1 /TAXON_ID=1158023 /ORGANISM="Astrosyne radiata, Strain 13vi08-1A" /LENGTH=496 /DNA_ID=CAMNT_0004453177 /DNA_START=17 /DNA_END=1507 /DNA_ORIENTATION=-
MDVPSRLVIIAGTYDGVLAGWERTKEEEEQEEDGDVDLSLKWTMATPVHQGSIRSLALASSSASSPLSHPGTLVSCGYDEMLRMHDWGKRLHSSAEVRTPSDFGTPTCCSFAPPYYSLQESGKSNQLPSTHCLVGFSNGQLAVYKKRDWSLEHVLGGHGGGVASLAVHPTGKLALSGGQSDGKVKLWDLTKGRLAYTTRAASSPGKQKRRPATPPIGCIVWNKKGTVYNDICFLEGPEGLFVAAACNDGSLPVLAVQGKENDPTLARRALMAIHPVVPNSNDIDSDISGVVAGEERFKCIQPLPSYHAVTANSAGVISVINLKGAINMILTGDIEEEEEAQEENQAASAPAPAPAPATAPAPEQQQQQQIGESVVADTAVDEEEDEELAVDILVSMQLGTGARITCLTAWCNSDDDDGGPTVSKGELGSKQDEASKQSSQPEEDKSQDNTSRHKKRQAPEEMDEVTVAKARKLVSEAKKLLKDSKKKKKQRRSDKK